MTTIATEVWIGCALLQHNNPEGSFKPKQITGKVESEIQQGRLDIPLRSGVKAHATSHNVANKKADPAKLRLLTETINRERRLYRPEDPVHPTRVNGQTINDKNDIPAHYHYLIDWYRNVFLTISNTVEAMPVNIVQDFNQSHVQQKPKQRQKNIFDALSEDEIKKVLDNWLKNQRWNTQVAWGKQHGPDIIATIANEKWIIEVKGPGSRNAMRINYFLSILGEILQRMKDNKTKYSIALPDLKQYRNLWDKVPDLAKQRTQLTLLVVGKEGSIKELD